MKTGVTKHKASEESSVITKQGCHLLMKMSVEQEITASVDLYKVKR